MKTLERAVEDLQNDLKSASDESGRRQLELENVEKNLASSREQNSFLSERNMKLVKKCEDLAAENKAILSRLVFLSLSVFTYVFVVIFLFLGEMSRQGNSQKCDRALRRCRLIFV